MIKIIAVLIYCFVYQYVHINYLFKHFHYLGYNSEPISLEKAMLGIFFLLIPFFYYKKFKDSLFELLYVILYLLLYIPIVVTYLNHYESIWDFFVNIIYIVIGYFFIMQLAPSDYIKGHINKNSLEVETDLVNDGHSIKEQKFLVVDEYSLNNRTNKALLFLNILISIILISIFKSTISFVSFSDVYDHRSSLVISSPIIGYLIMWNTYLISPLTLITGLVSKNKSLIIFGTLGSILVYGINASKIVLFIPILIICFFYIRNLTTDILKTMSFFFSGVMLLMVVLSQWFFMLSAVILMRTFGICGLLTYQYDEFFKVKEYTYFSHINFVNFITGYYPYGNLSLGMVVSRFYDETSVANSNANFIATDGIASFGGIGSILICLLFALFLRLWYKASVNNYVVMKFMLIPFSFIVLNVGLFTAALSGGFVFLIFFSFLNRFK